MTDPIEFPPALMFEATVDWNIVGGTSSAGQTDQGTLPIITLSGGGYWMAKLNDIQPVDDLDSVRLFRAMRIIADGGSAIIIVPRHDVLQPWPVVAGVQITSYSPVTHDDGTYLSDGTGYAQDVIDITSGAAALRATSMNVTINNGSALQGGETFSITHDVIGEHLYEIGGVFDNGDGTYEIQYRPPLRGAIASGTRLNFDQPRCCMRLSAQDAMAFKLGSYPYLPQSVTFIEANLSAASV